MRAAPVALLIAALMLASTGFVWNQQRELRLKQEAARRADKAKYDDEFKQLEAALAPLKRIRSNLEVGLNYGEFGSRLADAKADIDRLRDKHFQQVEVERTLLLKHMDAAMLAYTGALKIWREKIDSSLDMEDAYDDLIQSKFGDARIAINDADSVMRRTYENNAPPEEKKRLEKERSDEVNKQMDLEYRILAKKVNMPYKDLPVNSEAWLKQREAIDKKATDKQKQEAMMESVGIDLPPATATP